MPGKYEIIDLTKWKRATHCAIFRNCTEPCFCVTFELDVTDFRRAVRSRGLSFTMSMIFAVSECANKIEELRYRFLDGNVVLYKSIGTAFTYFDPATSCSRS